jgi:hypothetical protein
MFLRFCSNVFGVMHVDKAGIWSGSVVGVFRKPPSVDKARKIGIIWLLINPPGYFPDGPKNQIQRSKRYLLTWTLSFSIYYLMGLIRNGNLYNNVAEHQDGSLLRSAPL